MTRRGPRRHDIGRSPEQKSENGRENETSNAGTPALAVALPAIVLLVVLLPLWLLFEARIKAEILFAAALAVSAFLTHRFRWDRGSALALFAGWLSVLTAPDNDLYPLAFLCFVPLLMALDGATRIGQAAAYGLFAGATQILVGDSWGPAAFANFCETGPLASFLLYLPFTVLISLKMPVFGALHRVNRRYLQIPDVVFIPALITALEVVKVELYPWYLSLALSKGTVFLQIADCVGMSGVTGFIFLVNVGAYAAWRGVVRKERPWRWATMGAAAAALAFVSAYGTIRVRQIQAAESRTERRLAIAAIQADSPSKILNNDVATKKGICDTLYALAKQASETCAPDLIVFSEGATAMGYQAGFNPGFRETFDRIAADFQVALLLDNIHFESRSVYYRGSLLLNPDATIQGEYLKHRLVPFGEYVPLETTFPALRSIFKNVKNYRRGTEFPALEVKGIRLAPQICFEAIHPALTREYLKTGAEVIINQTNDSWYGREKESLQHLALARFRAIENRVPMARVANTGVSAFLSATGEYAGPLSPYGGPWVGCWNMPVAKVYSFYREHGNVFGYACLALLAALAAWRTWKIRRTA